MERVREGDHGLGEAGVRRCLPRRASVLVDGQRARHLLVRNLQPCIHRHFHTSTSTASCTAATRLLRAWYYGLLVSWRETGGGRLEALGGSRSRTTLALRLVFAPPPSSRILTHRTTSRMRSTARRISAGRRRCTCEDIEAAATCAKRHAPRSPSSHRHFSSLSPFHAPHVAAHADH